MLDIWQCVSHMFQSLSTLYQFKIQLNEHYITGSWYCVEEIPFHFKHSFWCGSFKFQCFIPPLVKFLCKKENYCKWVGGWVNLSLPTCLQFLSIWDTWQWVSRFHLVDKNYLWLIFAVSAMASGIGPYWILFQVKREFTYKTTTSLTLPMSVVWKMFHITAWTHQIWLYIILLYQYFGQRS